MTLLQTATAPIPVRRRSPWRWKSLLAAAVILAALPLGYMWYRSSADERELAALLAELDQSDPGWRLEELLARRKPVPEEQSAAHQARRVLKAATSNLESSPVFGIITQLERSPKNVQLSAGQVGELRRFFKQEAAARAEAFKLKDMPLGSFDEEKDGSRVWFDAARQVRLWLFLDAVLLAQDQDGDAALAACRAKLNVAHAYGVEPGEQGLQWCKQFHPNAIHLLERVLAQTQPSEDALKQMQAALTWETTLDLRQALRGNRARSWSEIEQALAGDRDAPGVIGNPATLRGLLSHVIPVATKGDAADYLRGMKRLLESVEQPVDGRFDELTQLTKKWEDSGPLFLRAVQRNQQSIWEHCWSQTHLRMAIVAVAAERYRLRSGAWPAALEDLVTASLLERVPVDPFDGQPLRWDRNADGVSVRSARHGSFRLWDPAARRHPAPREP